MKLLKISCNSCGAPLSASAKTQFITCQFCDARLRVVYEDSSVWTVVIEGVQEDVRELQTRLELLEIDQRWENEREQHMLPVKGGGAKVPNSTDPLVFTIGALLLLGAGIFGLSSGSPELRVFAFGAALLVGFFAALYRSKLDRYQSALSRYLSRRRSVRRKGRRERREAKQSSS